MAESADALIKKHTELKDHCAAQSKKFDDFLRPFRQQMTEIENKLLEMINTIGGESIKAALKWIRSLTAEPEIGEIYDGKIVKVMDFGAFVNFFGPKDGLVHVSELARERVAKPGDVVKEGQAVKVKLLGFDDRGKVRLSMKQVDQTTGEDLSKKQAAEA